MEISRNLVSKNFAVDDVLTVGHKKVHGIDVFGDEEDAKNGQVHNIAGIIAVENCRHDSKTN